MKQKDNQFDHKNFLTTVVMGAVALCFVLIVAVIANALGSRLVGTQVDAKARITSVNGRARSIAVGPRQGLWVGVGSGKGIYVSLTGTPCVTIASSTGRCERRRAMGTISLSYHDANGVEQQASSQNFSLLRGESVAFPSQQNVVANANRYRLLVMAIGNNTATVKIIDNASGGNQTTSENSFIIDQPTANVHWQAGTTRTIQWDSPNFIRATDVRITLMPQGVVPSQSLAIAGGAGQTALSNCGGNDCKYEWAIPAGLQPQYRGAARIKIEILNSDSEHAVVGTSLSNIFFIDSASAK